MRKKKVMVLFGGRSGEHVVSLRSAASIMKAIDRNLYEIIPVGITREGTWLAGEDAWDALWEKRAPREASRAALLTDPTGPGLLVENAGLSGAWSFVPVDLAFPVLHGTYGEDGTIQGLFDMAGLPYAGSGVLASSAGMDKEVMKTLLARHGLPIARFICLKHNHWVKDAAEYAERVSSEIGFPCFVKPANLGSSVGITKVYKPGDFSPAVEEAFLYDEKVIIEEFIDGREIECSVLGDIEAQASPPGEIIPCNDFYDYNAKYIDDRSELIVPVELGKELEEMIKDLSCRTFKAIEASGLARVDFFLERASNRIIVNEINTMPGFTSISMYPKLWEAGGVGYRELVSRLLELAEARFRRRRSLLVTPPE